MNSKILNFGMVMLASTIISVGMFVYNSAQSTISNSMQAMSTQEIQAFNNEFTAYEGKQTGSTIKGMIAALIANANTYVDEPTKIPAVIFDKVNNTREPSILKVNVPEMSEVEPYITALNQIRNFVESKHSYWVTITYQDNGLIDAIYVFYDTENPDIYNEDIYEQKHNY